MRRKEFAGSLWGHYTIKYWIRRIKSVKARIYCLIWSYNFSVHDVTNKMFNNYQKQSTQPRAHRSGWVTNPLISGVCFLQNNCKPSYEWWSIFILWEYINETPLKLTNN